MKKFKWRSLLMAMAVMILPLGFASCSSDDDNNDGGSIEAPKYESEAAKYEITSSDAEYSSIELTASGNYIIIKNPSASGARALTRSAETSAAKHIALLRPAKRTVASRAGEWGSGILYGSYTKVGDNEYKLGNLGTLKVTVKNGVACSLNLVYSDGTTKTYDGNKSEAKVNASELTNFMCRTWNISQIRVYYKENGQTLFDITANSWNELGQKIKELIKNQYPDEDFDESDFYETNPAKQIVFTKNNTYMVLYEDSELAIANWKWENESQGLLRYSWDEESSYDDATGVATVSRSGDKLVVSEEHKEVEDGDTSIEGTVYTLTEAK